MVPSEVVISVAVIFGYQAIRLVWNLNLDSPPIFYFPRGRGKVRK